MEYRMVFSGKKEVSIEEFSPPSPGPRDVAVRTIVSLISPGTETIAYNRAFDPGTHWDRYVTYPFYPGYSAVGEVTDIGTDVTSLKPGQTVAVKRPHASMHVCAEDMCLPVPRVMDPQEASWFALAKITFMGAKAAGYTLGDRVLVIGGGPIGQLSLRWARAAGAETLICVDLVENRLKFAQEGGATHTFSVSPAEGIEDIIKACGGEKPDIVVDATGNPRAFAQALGAVRKFGTVILIGDTGSPESQHLTSDVVLRGITVRGAHDTHTDDTWTPLRIHTLFTSLAADGRFSLSGLNTHTFKPEECEKAYKLAGEQKADTMGILFEWS